jgi:hypothetical protein
MDNRIVEKVTAMGEGPPTLSSISLHRAAIQGYLIVLVGLVFVVENGLSVLTTDGSVTEMAGIVLGICAIGGGALGYFRPERFSRGTEPAPRYQYVLAGVATAAFVLTIFFALQG